MLIPEIPRPRAEPSMPLAMCTVEHKNRPALSPLSEAKGLRQRLRFVACGFTMTYSHTKDILAKHPSVCHRASRHVEPSGTATPRLSHGRIRR